MDNAIFIVLLLSHIFFNNGESCRSGWSVWINNYTASTEPMPDYVYGEGSGTGAGGDVEYMDYSKQNTFCPYPDGRIDNIECVTDDENEDSYENFKNLFYDEYGITCDTGNGFICFNDQLLDNFSICDDFKIRYYCNCSGHEDPTTSAPPTTTPVAFETRTVTPNVALCSRPTTHHQGSQQNSQQCCRCDKSVAAPIVGSMKVMICLVATTILIDVMFVHV